MSLIHQDGTGQVTFHMSQPAADGEIACTLGVASTHSPLRDIVDKCAKVWTTRMFPQFISSIKMTNTTILFQTGGNLFSDASVLSSGLAGSIGTTNQLPSQVSPVVGKITGFAGKKHRGRMYLPPVTVTQLGVDQNTLSASYITALQTAVDGMLTDLRNASYTGYTFVVDPVLLHSDPTLAVDALTSMSVRPRLGTQRGRIR